MELLADPIPSDTFSECVAASTEGSQAPIDVVDDQITPIDDQIVAIDELVNVSDSPSDATSDAANTTSKDTIDIRRPPHAFHGRHFSMEDMSRMRVGVQPDMDSRLAPVVVALLVGTLLPRIWSSSARDVQPFVRLIVSLASVVGNVHFISYAMEADRVKVWGLFLALFTFLSFSTAAVMASHLTELPIKTHITLLAFLAASIGMAKVSYDRYPPIHSL